MKPAIELFLLTSATCNLRCKSCPTGRREKSDSGVMSLDMLDHILAKGTQEAKVLLVQLYFLNEPLLIPHIGGMVRLCRKYGLRNIVSTNLNSFRYGHSLMNSQPDRLIISVSGFTQDTYCRSHRGGDIERVKENMRYVALLRRPGTEVQVSWHRYKYNEHEMAAMKEYATSLGFTFVAYATSLLPQKLALDVWRTGVDVPGSEDLLVSVKDARQPCWERRHWDCAGQDRIVGVDSRGILIHCNCDGFGEDKERGSLFDTTIPAFLKARKTDPECAACKAVGGHIYGMQCWSRPEWSPMRLAGTLCRRLRIDGYMEEWLRRLNYGTKFLPLSK